jgi:predicted  nucleic acid-binding Zn-ribbon protein
LDANQGEDLKDEIKGKIRQLPTRISETERKLKVENKKLYNISDCKSSFDIIEKLESDMKKIQEDLKKVEVKLRENSTKIEDIEMQIVEPESKRNLLDGGFLSDMVKLDELTRGIAMKTKEIQNLKSKLPEELPVKSLADAKNELRQINSEIKSKNEIVESLNQNINQTQ